MTQKFQVGDRVQFIGANTILSGVIKADEEDLYTVITDDAHTYFFTEDYLALAPALVVVPEIIHTVIEERGRNKEYVIRSVIDDYYKEVFESEILEWFDTSGNILKFYSAVLNGYTVEKEPLYYVKVVDDECGYLNYEVSSGIYDLAGKGNDEDIKTRYTKLEIKEINEKLWAFAVPVEEGEG